MRHVPSARSSVPDINRGWRRVPSARSSVPDSTHHFAAEWRKDMLFACLVCCEEACPRLLAFLVRCEEACPRPWAIDVEAQLSEHKGVDLLESQKAVKSWQVLSEHSRHMWADWRPG